MAYDRGWVGRWIEQRRARLRREDFVFFHAAPLLVLVAAGFRTSRLSDGFPDKRTRDGGYRLCESVDDRPGLDVAARRPFQSRLCARVRGQSVRSQSRPPWTESCAELRAKRRYPDGVEARSVRPLVAALDRNGEWP